MTAEQYLDIFGNEVGPPVSLLEPDGPLFADKDDDDEIGSVEITREWFDVPITAGTIREWAEECDDFELTTEWLERKIEEEIDGRSYQWDLDDREADLRVTVTLDDPVLIARLRALAEEVAS